MELANFVGNQSISAVLFFNCCGCARRLSDLFIYLFAIDYMEHIDDLLEESSDGTVGTTGLICDHGMYPTVCCDWCEAMCSCIIHVRGYY